MEPTHTFLDDAFLLIRNISQAEIDVAFEEREAFEKTLQEEGFEEPVTDIVITRI